MRAEVVVNEIIISELIKQLDKHKSYVHKKVFCLCAVASAQVLALFQNV